MNCKITENYFAEKARMTTINDNDICGIACEDCPLSRANNGENVNCRRFETKYPNKAIAIIQKWSDEHPQKTMLDDFKEKYPNYDHVKGSTTPTFCPYQLGYEKYQLCKCGGNYKCAECWNRPLDEVIK